MQVEGMYAFFGNRKVKVVKQLTILTVFCGPSYLDLL